jgi:iron complex transport system ATP-binding protein
MKIRVSDVAFDYPGRPVLDDVSFDVRAGTLVGVLGPNGAGKSTLLRCMHAALEPSHGGVLVDGADLATMSRRNVALRVGVVPQSCIPGFQVTVAEVDMTEHAVRSVHELSGGEFRRVLIAQALAQEAPALLLDEPVQQLDILHQLEVMELVRRIARRPGAAAVVVLHDLGLAARYCDELVLLAAGRVAAVGAPEDVITEENLRTVYGVEAAVDRCPETGSVRVVPLRPAGARAAEVVEGRTR